jgi:hypothetical protein
MHKIKFLYTERGINIDPNNLHFIEKNRITETLFGDSTNYWHHWNDRFIISGKAIDIYDIGILFKVDSFKKIK